MSENFGDPPSESAPRRRRSFDVTLAWARALGTIGIVVRWLGTLAASLLAVHVVLTLGNANPENGITQFVTQWAQPLALGFNDLFMPPDPKLEVLVNYGTAALFWLLVTSIAMRILHKLGPGN